VVDGAEIDAGAGFEMGVAWATVLTTAECALITGSLNAATELRSQQNVRQRAVISARATGLS